MKPVKSMGNSVNQYSGSEFNIKCGPHAKVPLNFRRGR